MNAVEANLSDLKVRNYVRKADPKVSYWFSFYVRKMQNLASKFGNDFFIIIYGAKDIDNDYFVIPYEKVKDVLIDENTTGINSKAKDAKTRTPRWSGNIVNNRLRVTHGDGRIDLTGYYGNRLLLDKAIGSIGDKIADPPQFDGDAADTTAYDPENVYDARDRTVRAITLHRGRTGGRTYHTLSRPRYKSCRKWIVVACRSAYATRL